MENNYGEIGNEAPKSGLSVNATKALSLPTLPNMCLRILMRISMNEMTSMMEVQRTRS